MLNISKSHRQQYSIFWFDETCCCANCTAAWHRHVLLHTSFMNADLYFISSFCSSTLTPRQNLASKVSAIKQTPTHTTTNNKHICLKNSVWPLFSDLTEVPEQKLNGFGFPFCVTLCSVEDQFWEGRLDKTKIAGNLLSASGKSKDSSLLISGTLKLFWGHAWESWHTPSISQALGRQIGISGKTKYFSGDSEFSRAEDLLGFDL